MAINEPDFTVSKIRNFTDLIAWREARILAVNIYQSTESFPKKEIYSLTDQMRRCGVSVCSNIAEGFSRQSKAEKIHFYHIAKGSLTEVHNQILIAKEILYLNDKEVNEIVLQIEKVGRLITGLIKSLRQP